MQSRTTGSAPVDLGTGSVLTRLVVPITLDHDHDRGVAVATRLAANWGLPLRLTSIDPDHSDSVDLTLGGTLESIRTSLATSHPEVTVDDELLATGEDPISALAEQLDDGDLVVMASSGAGPDHVTMSFAQALSHEWGGPIVMVGPVVDIEASMDGDVIVALDGSGLAERGLAAATGLARALGGNVRLVQAVPRAMSAHVEELRARGEQVSESAYIRDVCDRADDPTLTWEIIHAEDPAEALVRFADEHDASFIAMATHGMSALVRPAFGSVCMATVRTSTRPLLVTRPVVRHPELLLTEG